MVDEEMFLGRDRFCEEDILLYFNNRGEEKNRDDLNVNVDFENIH